MTLYFLFFLIAAVPTVLRPRDRHGVYCGFAFLAYVLFVGLRHQVGGDWDGYILITEDIAQSSLFEAFESHEVLFAVLTWISTRMGFGVYGANLVGALVFSAGLFAFCRRQENRWAALTMATPFLAIVTAMSANRQALAIGVVLYVFSRWKEWGVSKRVFGIVVATLFHSSAGLLLPIALADAKVPKFAKFVLLGLSIGGSFWLLLQSEAAFTRYTTIYVEQPEGVQSSGAIFHLALNLLPALVMAFGHRKWAKAVPEWSLIRLLIVVAFLLAVLVPFFSVAAGRMSLYLFPISMVFVSKAPEMWRDLPTRRALAVLFVVASACVLWVWLSYGNTASAFLPYRNALWVESNELVLPSWVAEW